LTFLVTVSFPKISQSFARSLYRSFLVTLSRASEQKHDCSIDIREVDAKTNPAGKSHFVQAAPKGRAITQVIMFLDSTEPSSD
jgi:hypothetical protein